MLKIRFGVLVLVSSSLTTFAEDAASRPRHILFFTKSQRRDSRAGAEGHDRQPFTPALSRNLGPHVWKRPGFSDLARPSRRCLDQPRFSEDTRGRHLLGCGTLAAAASSVIEPAQSLPTQSLKEQHFTIRYGEVGQSYESIVGPYLVGAKEVVVEDPYIRMTHQIQNFVRFCEAVVKSGTVKKISLITGYDDEAKLAEVQEKMIELQQSLADADVILDTAFNKTIHDREIRIDTGWVVKIGRGLDFYQKPGSWFELGATDLSMRKCLETKVDIFKQGSGV